MKKFILILITIVSYSHSDNILDMYDSYSFDESYSSMNSAYTGPLITVGGAMIDTQTNDISYISDMNPEKVGFIETNNITLIDSINEIYSFDSISYYNVTKNADTFYVMKIISKMNNENYDIIIELNDGPNYDRILNIYKKGKIKMMILWIGLENPRLRVKELKKI